MTFDILLTDAVSIFDADDGTNLIRLNGAREAELYAICRLAENSGIIVCAIPHTE